jgi:V8-like Glu-specific endopeptidase
MHNYRLISLLNSSGLAAERTARIGFVLAFLCFCHGAMAGLEPKERAGCKEALFPAATSEWLLPSKKMLDATPSCAYSNIDLAQWYFWGGGNHAANIERSHRYALAAVKDDRWPYELALLHAAFVIKGLDKGLGVDEALRRFQREISSGDDVRRDKALAMLNQLSEFLPRVLTTAGAVYADAKFKKPIALPPTPALQISHRGSKRQIIVADTSGAPILYWAGKVLAAEQSQQNAVFQRSPAKDAQGADDVRQQLWRVPAAMPRSGVLLSRFKRDDGSPYESRCTATQLAPQWLISASHCLFTPEGSGSLVSIKFIAEPLSRRSDDMATMIVSGAWRHRQHRAVDQHNGELAHYSGSDIALFKLSTPLHLDRPAVLAEPNTANHWIDSLAFPNDKSLNTLWASRCRARLWQAGVDNLSDLFALDCFSFAGQSGAVLTQYNRGQRQIIGVLSSRIYNDSINQPVFAALNTALIRDIKAVLAGRSSELFVAVPITSRSNLAAVKP